MQPGILGYSSKLVVIENCYNTGAISGQWYASGICGFDTLPASKITNCYNSGTITATNGGSYYAGITANFRGTISNSYYANPAADALAGTTPATATQITSPEGLADMLGNAFKEDTAGAQQRLPHPRLAGGRSGAARPAHRADRPGYALAHHK